MVTICLLCSLQKMLISSHHGESSLDRINYGVVYFNFLLHDLLIFHFSILEQLFFIFYLILHFLCLVLEFVQQLKVFLFYYALVIVVFYSRSIDVIDRCTICFHELSQIILISISCSCFYFSCFGSLINLLGRFRLLLFFLFWQISHIL